MPKFTRGELETMQVLWDLGEAKPSEIQAAFPRPIKNPALRSYLTILLDKGHVTRRKVGKAYYYRAKTPREPAFQDMVRGIAETFCEGSAEGLMVRMIKSQKLTEEQLLRLKRIADGETPDEPPRRRKR